MLFKFKVTSCVCVCVCPYCLLVKDVHCAHDLNATCASASNVLHTTLDSNNSIISFIQEDVIKLTL